MKSWQSKFVLCGGAYAVILTTLAFLAPYRIAAFYVLAMASMTTLAVIAHLLYHYRNK